MMGYGRRYLLLEIVRPSDLSPSIRRGTSGAPSRFFTKNILLLLKLCSALLRIPEHMENTFC